MRGKAVGRRIIWCVTVVDGVRLGDDEWWDYCSGYFWGGASGVGH